ncbi:MAG: hybrid sensor histidine kinase/response regulator [Elusimicrobia bacterium]|nr:hybrid sensor histidine kinase/response regulator [Elusimicrobiota bacterium]
MRDTKISGKILVVDDEPHLLDLLVDVLSEDGYTVDGVATGTAAIFAARRTVYHVALLDYELGDMTGLALAKELRRTNEDINIILMTAHATLDMAVKAIQADVYDYLIKPIDSNQLKRSLDNALEKNHLTVENKRLMETLQKTNAELVRMSQQKSRFLSIVSHDLRSPLTSIRGYAQLLQLKEGVEPDQMAKFLSIIVSQSDHLAGLISDLMDIVSIEAGKLRIDKKLAVVTDILASVEARMAALAVQKKIIFKTVIEGKDFPAIPIDRKRMDQVLTNLIGNAFKHTPADQKVTVCLARTPDHFRFEVTDTGEGIPLEALPHIFEEYYQADAHISKKEGLGLGLTIAREIVHAHGGEIGAQSEGPGKGALFWFTLPLPAEK